ncbi:MAG: AAA family ATPase [bacterium]
MKIALIGASSTGKSTLSKLLAKELRLPLIREQARVVLAEMGKTLPELRAVTEDIIRFQYAVLQAQIDSETECADSGFVSDRSIFDNLVLFLRHCEVSSHHIRSYEEIVLTHYKNLPYDLLIFLRPGEFPVEDDGVRTPNPYYQSQVDGMILTILKLYSVPTVEVTGDPLQRVRNTKAHIEKHFPGWLESRGIEFDRSAARFSSIE